MLVQDCEYNRADLKARFKHRDSHALCTYCAYIYSAAGVVGTARDIAQHCARTLLYAVRWHKDKGRSGSMPYVPVCPIVWHYRYAAMLGCLETGGNARAGQRGLQRRFGDWGCPVGGRKRGEIL